MFRGDWERYLFYIAVLTLLLAYWVAVTHELPVIFKGLVQLWYAATARNDKGNFANYPK